MSEEQRKVIIIRYCPTVSFPNVENMAGYMNFCKERVLDLIEILNKDPKASNIIYVPDAIAGVYIELYAKCLNCDVAYLNMYGDAVSRDDFYRPFARLMRESELYREQMEEWLKGEAENPLIGVEE